MGSFWIVCLLLFAAQAHCDPIRRLISVVNNGESDQDFVSILEQRHEVLRQMIAKNPAEAIRRHQETKTAFVSFEKRPLVLRARQEVVPMYHLEEEIEGVATIGHVCSSPLPGQPELPCQFHITFEESTFAASHSWAQPSSWPTHSEWRNPVITRVVGDSPLLHYVAFPASESQRTQLIQLSMQNEPVRVSGIALDGALAIASAQVERTIPGSETGPVLRAADQTGVNADQKLQFNDNYLPKNQAWTPTICSSDAGDAHCPSTAIQ